MSEKKRHPIIVDVALTDDQGIEALAEALGTTPDDIRTTIGFVHQIFANAEKQELNKGQLVSALLAALSTLVKEYDSPDERTEMLLNLCQGLWAACGNYATNGAKEPRILVTSNLSIVH